MSKQLENLSKVSKVLLSLDPLLYDSLRKHSGIIDSTTLFYETFKHLKEDDFSCFPDIDEATFVKLQEYHNSLETVILFADVIADIESDLSYENSQCSDNVKHYIWKDLLLSNGAAIVLSHAQRLVCSDGRKMITAKDIWKSLYETRLGGWYEYLTFTKKDFYITRIHECGHAVISYLNEKSTLWFICSLPTENRGGYTITAYHHSNPISKEDLFNSIMRLMAGIAALSVCAVELKNYAGASSDYKDSIDIAREIAIYYDGLTDEIDIQERIQYYINKALNDDIDILRKHIDLIHLGVKKLEEHNDVYDGIDLTSDFKNQHKG